MIVLGVDAGGSHTEAVVLDGDGRELARELGGPGWAGNLTSAARNIGDTARRAIQRAGGATPDRAVIGAAGAGDPRIADRLAATLAGLAKDVRVTTDAEVALAAAFGRDPGIVLLAGTGSIAIARRPDGSIARAGGKGPDVGDEGSGYWLGKAALTAGLVTGLGTDRMTVAALAPQVVRLADADNAVARGLVGEAADALVTLVAELAVQFPGEVPVVCAGGILTGAEALRAAVAARLPDNAVLRPEPIDPALGAARLALSP